MKTYPALAILVTGFIAGSASAADLKPQVNAAIQQLTNQPNYSWKTTTVVPEPPSPTRT